MLCCDVSWILKALFLLWSSISKDLGLMGLCLHSFTIIPKLENRIEKYTQSAWREIRFTTIRLFCCVDIFSPLLSLPTLLTLNCKWSLMAISYCTLLLLFLPHLLTPFLGSAAGIAHTSMMRLPPHHSHDPKKDSRPHPKLVKFNLPRSLSKNLQLPLGELIMK